MMLHTIPFVFPFDKRVELFQRFINNEADLNNANWLPPITIRRKYLLEDAYSKLAGYGPAEFKQPLRVQFLSNEGHLEEGIGQGVFKEFLIEYVQGSVFGFFF